MAPAIPLIAIAAQAAIASAAISVVAQVALGIGVSLLLTAAARALADEPDLSSSSLTSRQRDNLVTVRQPAGDRQVILGRARVAGVPVRMFTTGDNGRLNIVVAWAGHECEAIDEYWIDDHVIYPRDLDADGLVKPGLRYANNLHIRTKLGTDGQAHDSFIASLSEGQWTATDRLRGICYTIFRLAWAGGAPWPNGVPNFTAVIKGAKVFDPRDSQTRWSPNMALMTAHYLANDRFGLAAPMGTEIDTSELIASANVAEEFVEVQQASDAFTADASNDELARVTENARWLLGDRVQVSTTGTLPAGLAAATDYYVVPLTRADFKLAASYANAVAGTAITITDAGSGTHTATRFAEPRYRGGGAFKMSEAPRSVIESMLSGMAGDVVWTGGTWLVRAGYYRPPTVPTLDETVMHGAIRSLPKVSMREQFNGIRGTFRDPWENWQFVDFAAVENATYLAQDNAERAWQDVSFPWTASPSAAQRLAKIELEQSRQQESLEVPLSLIGLRLRATDVAPVTYSRWGIADKPYKVTEWSLAKVDGRDGGDIVQPAVALRETAAGVYDWNSGEETVGDPAPNTNLPDPFTVGAPGTPVIIEALYQTRDGDVKSKAVITWAAAGEGFLAHYEVDFRIQPETVWTRLAETEELQAEILDITPGTVEVRVRAVTLFAASAYQQASKAVVGVGAAPADVAGFNIQILSDNAVLATWNQHADLDVRLGGRILFRHSPSTSGDWTDSTRIGEPGFVQGSLTSAVLPNLPGTYMAKAEDRVGVRSTNAALFASDGDSARNWTTVATITENPAFTGAKTEVEASSSKLRLDGTDLDGTYWFNGSDDRTAKTRVRVRTEIDAVITNQDSLIDSRLDNIDDWEDFDGTGAASATAWIEFRFTDDDPAGSPTWSTWRRLDIAEVNARAFEFRCQLLALDSAYNIEISTLKVYVETADT